MFFLNAVEVAYFSTGVVVGIGAVLFFMLLVGLLASGQTTEHHYTLTCGHDDACDVEDYGETSLSEIADDLGDIAADAEGRGHDATAADLWDYVEYLEAIDDE